MHELSIVLNLIEIAEKAARDAGAERIEVAHLKLGRFAGVVKESLVFSYDLATQGTLLEGSRLEIEDIPLLVYCQTCDREIELPSIQLFQCPHCENPVLDIRHGREIELTSVEVCDRATQTA